MHNRTTNEGEDGGRFTALPFAPAWKLRRKISLAAALARLHRHPQGVGLELLRLSQARGFVLYCFHPWRIVADLVEVEFLVPYYSSIRSSARA